MGSTADVVGYDGGSFNRAAVVSETVAPAFVPPPLIVPVIRRARFILFLYARQVLCLRDRCTIYSFHFIGANGIKQGNK